jgi:hypothetical protein
MTVTTPGRRADSGPRPRVAQSRRHRLTATGAVLVAGVAALAGALLDQAISGAPGVLFGVLLCLGCLAAVTRARRSALPPTVVMVPLIYAGCLLVCAVVTGSSPGLTGRLMVVFTDAVENAPSLFVATALTGLLAWARWRMLPATDARTGTPRRERF